jgi:hypothetical protein
MLAEYSAARSLDCRPMVSKVCGRTLDAEARDRNECIQDIVDR